MSSPPAAANVQLPCDAADAVDWSAAPRPIVFVSGCYDLLHSGHVRFFKEASALGHLYVSVGNDANILALKQHKAMFPEAERRYMVQSIDHVRWARVCSGMGYLDWENDLDVVRPDIFFVNEDGDHPAKREACNKRGIKYMVATRTPEAGLPTRSSTSIKKALRDASVKTQWKTKVRLMLRTRPTLLKHLTLLRHTWSRTKFDDSSEASIAQIIDSMTCEIHPRGVTLCEQGAEADRFFIVCDGVCGISQLSQHLRGDGSTPNPDKVGVLREGQVFGETAFQTNPDGTPARCSTTIRVESETATVLVLSRFQQQQHGQRHEEEGRETKAEAVTVQVGHKHFKNNTSSNDLYLSGHWTEHRAFTTATLSADQFQQLPTASSARTTASSAFSMYDTGTTPIPTWDIVAVTARLQGHAVAFAEELDTYPELSGCPLIIPVSDLTIDAKMGSGGASLQALVAIVERLSARAGDPYLNERRLLGKRILILHSGASFCNPTPWTPTPACDIEGHSMTGVRSLLQALPSRQQGLINGQAEKQDCTLFICSCEMDSSSVQLCDKAIPWSLPGLIALASRCPVSEAVGRHGVYQLAETPRHNVRLLRKVVYKGTDLSDCILPPSLVHDQSEDAPMVAMAIGLFKMDYTACAAFFALHAQAPFASCTTFGMDDGMPLIGFSLFQDVLPACCDAACVPCDGDPEVDPRTGQRKGLTALRPLLGAGRFKTHVVLASGAGHVRYFHAPRDHTQYTSGYGAGGSGRGGDGAGGSSNCRSILLNTVITGSSRRSSGEAAPASIALGAGAVVLDSELCGGWSIGNNAVVIGWRGDDVAEALCMPPNCTLQTLELTDGGSEGAPTLVTTLIGNEDTLFAPCDAPGSVFLGQPWDAFWARTGIQPRELWPAAGPHGGVENRSLVQAKLFSTSVSPLPWIISEDPAVIARGVAAWRAVPMVSRLSLADVFLRVNLGAHFKWNADLRFRIDCCKVQDVLLCRKHEQLRSVYARCAKTNDRRIFGVLEDIAATTTGLDIAARALAHIADVLGAFAGREGGLRSGPARSPVTPIGPRAESRVDQGARAAGRRVNPRLRRERDGPLARGCHEHDHQQGQHGLGAYPCGQALRGRSPAVDSTGHGDLPAVRLCVQGVGSSRSSETAPTGPSRHSSLSIPHRPCRRMD